MIRPRLLTAGTMTALAVAAVLLAFPAGVAANSNTPIAQTGGMTATLPILGGGVSVTVALGPAGNVSAVTVSNPALAQTKSTSTFVKFATSDGSTKVTVKAMGSRLAISAKVTTLAELVGSGTWTADVFGTGTKSSAAYTIGADTNGNPTVSLATPTGLPTGVTWTAAAPKTWTGNDGAMATAGGTFAFDGFTKRLTITVSVGKGDGDDPGYASLGITLTGRDVQVLTGTLAQLAAAGSRTWSAYLCDGTTAVAVNYHVNADGTIGYDGATGATATQKTRVGGLAVRFTGTNVGVRISLKNNGNGTYTLNVRGSSGICAKGGGNHNGGGDHDGGGFHGGYR